ncbi:exosortase [Granulicella pectinivorans]|uniref:Exosortase n=1 Tax=Granulicella pectinivorans TaxID=474950 RepID=A0A1I6MMH4_9BACT|nr:exosortase/archaeosortase family protein [Granulicella pectinivorans]SFS16854.1 exosortase [Granulicella pectinivorans]
MVKEAEIPIANIRRGSSVPKCQVHTWVMGVLILALVFSLYLDIGIKLVSDWFELPDFSHGFLIPFFVAFLVWDQRRILFAEATSPSWWGLTLVAAGVVTLLTGVFGADLFLSRISFILLCAGLIWTLAGRRALGKTKFILFVLLLAIPLPTLLFNQITFPLQLFASRLASAALPLAGVPVLRDGNVIQLPAMQLEVAEACSGIRSLLSLFTVAVIYGYFLEPTRWRRLALALAAVPIAVAANALRIVGTGLCVQYWNPDKAIGFFHEFSGWLMFVISLCCLFFIHSAMRLIARKAVSV